MKVSFITTVFNEANSINQFIDSIKAQSILPDEIIVVDGGSTDDTASLIVEQSKKNNLKIHLFVKNGNRSVGRNEAIGKSTGDIIVCTDAGCILDKDWVKNIIAPFKDSGVDVVAGYYRGAAKTLFQKVLIPYFLVMPDQVSPNSFLPATRSMAFKKKVWKEIGGFNEKLSHNEDYEFAKKIKKNDYKISFARDAVVNWIPPGSLKKVFVTFFRFAFGDAEAGIFRPKAIFVVGRYLLGLIILFASFYTNSLFLELLIPILLFNYFLWAILKNYIYVKDLKGIILLPFMQFLSDIAVITGTILGFIKNHARIKI